MKKVSEGLGGRSKHSPMSVSSQMRSVSECRRYSACVSASTRFQVKRQAPAVRATADALAREPGIRR